MFGRGRYKRYTTKLYGNKKMEEETFMTRRLKGLKRTHMSCKMFLLLDEKALYV
jgi:hypothetical protein